MGMKRIRATNFKSFKELDIELGKFNVLIGANASGKSNVVQVFKFLRDIVHSGLDNAISMQGGIEYLRNLNIGVAEYLSFHVVSDKEYEFIGRRQKEDIIGIKIYETVYEFALKFKKRGLGFRIAQDNLKTKCKFYKLERRNGKLEERDEIGDGEMELSSTNGNVKINIRPEHIPITKDDIYPSFLFEKSLPSKSLLLESPFLFMPPLRDIFSGISIYYFDPKLPKKATPITGKAELEEDGSNLSIILKNITEDKEKRRKLFNLVQALLPFIIDLGVEKFADKSLLFKLQEKYYDDQHLPASLISDGTINITALIVALYFEESPVTIIEEPERNIHPYLISRVVDMMKDASEKKQIIVTTHNPEIVKHVDFEDLFLVSRDENGFSNVSRPAEKEELLTFFQNDIGVEDLYIQNLLGG